jgi:hypothetical protein
MRELAFNLCNVLNNCTAFVGVLGGCIQGRRREKHTPSKRTFVLEISLPSIPLLRLDFSCSYQVPRASRAEHSKLFHKLEFHRQIKRDAHSYHADPEDLGSPRHFCNEFALLEQSGAGEAEKSSHIPNIPTLLTVDLAGHAMQHSPSTWKLIRTNPDSQLILALIWVFLLFSRNATPIGSGQPSF